MSSEAKITWMKWNDLPWFSQSEPGGAAIHLSERLLGACLELEDAKTLLHEMLPELATEFAVQWAAVVEQNNSWTLRGQCGRFPLEELPFDFLDQIVQARGRVSANGIARQLGDDRRALGFDRGH